MPQAPPSTSDLLSKIESSVGTATEDELIEILDDFFRLGGSTNGTIAKYPLLNYFAKKGKPLLVNHLLIRSPDKNQIDSDGLTPLQQITTKDNKHDEETVLRITQDLLRAGASVDSTSSSKQRPLLNAIDRNHSKVVRALARYKPNFTKFQEPFGSALWVACYRGLTEIVEYLLANGANVNDEGLQETSSSNYYGHQTTSRKRTDLVSPLMIACSRGHIEVVRILLAKGAKEQLKDASGNHAIHHACNAGHLSCVECLMIWGNNVQSTNGVGETPLQVAVAFRRSQLIEKLIALGSSVSDREYLLAIQQVDSDSLRSLLVFGRASTKKGNFTAPSLKTLNAAVAKKNKILIGILLQEGNYDKSAVEDFVARDLKGDDYEDLKKFILDEISFVPAVKEEVGEEQKEAGSRRKRNE